MTETTEIIIIGAGIAGLAAANRLKSWDYDVIVLEAQNRIGGRIHTDWSWGISPVELGATWIHGDENNPLMKLVKKFNLKTIITEYENHWLYDTKGKLISDRKQEQLEDDFDEVLEEFEEFRETLEAADEDDISLQAALDIVLTDWDLTPQQQRIMDYFINAEIEHEYAADAEELSCYYWDEGEEVFGWDRVLPGGYDQLIQVLATNLDIRLEQPVEAIAYNNQGVTITTATQTFHSNQAILTVPLGVLKRKTIQFSPPLPTSKQTAIRNLGMGVLNKTVFRFPHIFWDKEADLIGHIPAQKGQWTEFFNLAKVTGQPILVGFNAGSYARHLESQSDNDIIQSALQVLQTLYKPSIPQPEAYQITRWASHPYSWGSYSYLATGASDRDYDNLADPVGDRLFFAGEATSRQHAATVHGAYLSGLREAQRIDDLYE